MIQNTIICSFLTVFVSFSAIAGDILLAGDVKKGKELYRQKCMSCHGVKAEGKINIGPKLAGQHGWYLLRSLKAIQKNKDRKVPVMLPYVKNMKTQDFKNLVEYIKTIDACKK